MGPPASIVQRSSVHVHAASLKPPAVPVRNTVRGGVHTLLCSN